MAASKMTMVGLVLVTILQVTQATTAGKFYFSPNTVYSYDFKGKISMQDTVTLKVDAEVGMNSN